MSLEPTAAARRLVLFRIALVATLAWLLTLLALAILTANPQTLSRSQLLTADAVVVAHAEPSAVGDAIPLKVERVLSGADLPDRIVLHGADADRFREQTDYLIPLRRSTVDFTVAAVPTLHRDPTSRDIVMVPVDDPDAEGVFYLATDEALQAAERILTTASPRPYP